MGRSWRLLPRSALLSYFMLHLSRLPLTHIRAVSQLAPTTIPPAVADTLPPLQVQVRGALVDTYTPLEHVVDSATAAAADLLDSSLLIAVPRRRWSYVSVRVVDSAPLCVRFDIASPAGVVVVARFNAIPTMSDHADAVRPQWLTASDANSQLQSGEVVLRGVGTHYVGFQSATATVAFVRLQRAE